MSWKDKQCSIPVNEVISGNSLWGEEGVGEGDGEKISTFQNKTPYSLETLECNHKKFGAHPET